MDELLASSEWIVSTHSDGEVLAAWVEGAGLRVGFLGDRRRFHEPEVRGLLTDLVHVALETSGAPAALAGPATSIPIPLLLHHALSGLLFYENELWHGEPAPCCVAITEAEEGIALGCTGSGSVSISLAGRSFDPTWIVVRDDAGRTARACLIDDREAIRIVARWGPSSDAGEPGGGELEAQWPGPARIAPLAATAETRVQPAEPETAPDDAEPVIPKRPSRLWRFRSWMDRLAGPRRREPESRAESEDTEPIAHDVPGVPDQIAPFEPEASEEHETRVTETVEVAETGEAQASPAGQETSLGPADSAGILQRDWTDPFDLGSVRLPEPDLTVASVPGTDPASAMEAEPIEPEIPVVSALLDIEAHLESDTAPSFASESVLVESEPIALAAESTPWAPIEAATLRPEDAIPITLGTEPAAIMEAPPAETIEVEVRSAPQEIEAPPGPTTVPPMAEVASREIPLPVEAGEIEPEAAQPPAAALEIPDGARAAADEANEAAPVARRAHVRHPAWPEFEEIPQRHVSAAWKRTGFVAAVVLALFAAGWLLGRFDFAAGGKKLGAGLRALGLGPARCEVDVTSNPSGAWISVDGTDQALRTPATLRLAPGPHRIGLSISGVGGSMHAVQGRRGERVALDVQLRGGLAIRVPEGSVPTEVAIDGVPQGFLPLTVDQLAPGIHRLQFSGPGLSPWEQTVEVQVGRVTEMTAAPIASPPTGVLDVRATLADEAGSEPLPGAAIWIDGEKRGVTPLRLELPRGPHSVRATYREEEAAVEVIELPGGNERFVTLEFGVVIDRPRLQAVLPEAVPLDRPTVLSATLDRARPGDVREMWLHVRTPEGAWRRYPMNVMKAEDGVAGVTVFPVVLFDANGRTAWYVSAMTPMGDEYFTEIQTAQSGRTR
ncbi:MAG TPA: PEGA domain-containing protein [Terriglobales bacterium]|nr:PEGA domain-containing protein [Terriglobales bacterium]